MDELLSAPIGALLIFLLRMTDVSMAMTRMLFAIRGERGKAALLGFFEVLVWLFAVGSTLKHLDSPLHLIGYAAGFSMGNYVGVTLEERFALGVNVVRAVFREAPFGNGGTDAAAVLRDKGYAVTEMPGKGRESNVAILDIVVQRRKVPEVLRLLQEHDSNSFVTIEEVRATHGGYIGSPRVVRPAGRKMPFLSRV
jgi:uncharacterized protein YebE (UPF0316 family)